MPTKRPQLISGQIYHVILRGVGDQRIFKNINDYYRGVFSFYEFNTTKPIEINTQRRKREIIKTSGEKFIDSRDYLGEILAFCLMPNHIHLLIRQIKKDGITDFMRKCGTGYATYFNQKYKRKGHLFQGRFQAVTIKDDEQLRNIFVYIHTNPISLIEPKWKEKGIKNPKRAIKFLENYKWSSYSDYLGKNNFPSVTERKFLLKFLGKENGCKKFVDDWVRYNRGVYNFFNIPL